MAQSVDRQKNTRKNPRAIFRQKEVAKSLGAILRSDLSFIVDRRNFDKIYFAEEDAEYKDTFETALTLASTALLGMLQLHGVYDQLIIVFRMASYFPWDERQIKRSEHLHFVWMVFADLCYLFEEKFKLMAQAHNDAVRAFKTRDEIDVKVGVKRISKRLREHIKARGEHVHQWRRSHDVVGTLSTIELAHSFGGIPKDFDVREAYGWSQTLIRSEIRKAISFVEEVLLDVIERHKSGVLPTSVRITGALKRRLQAQSEKI